MSKIISFIDFTNMSDEEKYKLLNSKDYEIEKLNNIINELEEWLYDNTNYEEYDRVEKDTFNYVIKKIEELRNEEK